MKQLVLAIAPWLFALLPAVAAAQSCAAGQSAWEALPPRILPAPLFPRAADEYAEVKEKWPNQWVLETDAAFGAVEDIHPFQDCTPLYRLYNNRPDANHRYTTSTTIRDRMIAEGWILEAAYDHPYENAFSMCVLP